MRTGENATHLSITDTQCLIVLCLRHRIVTITPVAILCPSTTDARKIVGARIPNTTAESNMPTKSVADEDMAYPIGSDRLIREEEAGLY